jgi:hypothetical protein
MMKFFQIKSKSLELELKDKIPKERVKLAKALYVIDKTLKYDTLTEKLVQLNKK